jgi:addiction module HigA family antidote
MARTPIHPGEHLAEELKELGISAAELARQIKVPVNRVTGIINGQRAITADTALRLGHWFSTSPEFWLNLQKLYELRLARQEVGDRVDRLPRLIDRKRQEGYRCASPALTGRPTRFRFVAATPRPGRAAPRSLLHDEQPQ